MIKLYHRVSFNILKRTFILLSILYLSLTSHATAGQLLYSTFLGGSGGDGASGIAIDSAGNAYITGNTSSLDFPVTTNAFSTTLSNTNSNIFVSKINTNSFGTASLIYSTYLGGSGFDSNGDYSQGIAVDFAGNVYITGYTYSTDFPVTSNAYSTTLRGTPYTFKYSPFISKINTNSSGSTSLEYSTFFGGTGQYTISFGYHADYGLGIAVDSSGNAYITGYTDSTDFPVTASAFQTSNNNPLYGSAFVSKINTSSSGTASLMYSTYLGANGYGDSGNGIAVDENGNVYITGETSSLDFPVTTGALQTINNDTISPHFNAFVSKLNTSLSGVSSLVYSTYLGGSKGADGQRIVVDSVGNAYITGQTGSTDFPVTTDAFSTTLRNTNGNAFVSKINMNFSGTASLIYSTYLGGSGWPSPGDNSQGITVDFAGNAYITGYTDSTDFPVTVNAFQTTNRDNGCAFISKINPSLSGISSLIYSTFLGGSVSDGGYGIAVDSVGNAYITGETSSPDFPATTNAFSTILRSTNGNAFLTKLSISIPEAGFYGTPTSGYGLLLVTFVDTSWFNPTSWNWNFGDGGTSTVQNPTYTYGTVAVSTSYTVQLVVSNSYGTSTSTMSNYIQVYPGAPLLAGFYGTPTSGFSALTVNFTDTSANNPTSWNWNFGDNGTSTLENPSHIYTTVGTPTSYTVQLIVDNSYSSSTMTLINYISVSPLPDVEDWMLYSVNLDNSLSQIYRRLDEYHGFHNS